MTLIQLNQKKNHWKRKGFFFLFLFLFLQSCASKNLSHWQNTSIRSAIAPCRYEKITFPPNNSYSGMELEISSGKCGIHGYLNIFCLTFPPTANDPCQTCVHYSLSGTWESFTADRLKGGQRLHLPQEVTQKIIQALLADQTILFKVDRYEAKVTPKSFRKTYKSFPKSSYHFLPFLRDRI